MKTVLITMSLILSTLFSGCDAVYFGVIGGGDGPTEVYVKGRFGEQYEKASVRMFNAGGELYYDSGIVSDMTPRCGTLDGELKKAVKENEIPLKSGEANFDAEGYQSATGITKEVNIDGDWVIFKKFDTYGRTLDGLKYCHYIKGRLNNAAADSEIIALSENEDITFNDVYEPLLSSSLPLKSNAGKIVHNALPRDKWGLVLFADNVSSRGATIKFEQFGGKPSGELQTGAWYKLERIVDDRWQELEAKADNSVWYSIAYKLKKNDITELEVDWEYLYGELPSGYYRLSKEVMDFRAAGDYDKEIYQVDFEIE